MKPIDEQTLDRLIEKITSQVLLSLQEEPALRDSTAAALPHGARLRRARAARASRAGADRLAHDAGHGPHRRAASATSIDHTLLKPDATQDQIAQLCYEARKYGFASVCVNPV